MADNSRDEKDRADIILSVEGLKKHFPIRTGVFRRVTGHVRAVDGVSFDVRRNEILGVVGESGCGKSTTAKTVVRLLNPTEGKIMLEGTDIAAIRQSQLRDVRRDLQIVFQDPYGSLNRRMRVRSILEEPYLIHKVHVDSAERSRKVAELLDHVGLTEEQADRFPHAFSGGQRQRIGIARALALNPKLIVADEPVSALDVSIQAQIINLLQDLQERFGLTYILVAHDLSVIRHVSDRVAVMYLGKIVEIGPKQDIFSNTMHPYTRALLSAIPIPDPKTKRKRIFLEGDVPSPANPPTGCPFHTRCPSVMPICKTVPPLLLEYGKGHQTACHLHYNHADYEELPAGLGKSAAVSGGESR